MPRPIQAVIHLGALRHNLARAKDRAGARRVWAVVKANAYGHGLARVLPAFEAADGLALLDLDEAERARAAGWRKPILLLEGFFEPRDLEAVQRLNLTPVVHGDEQIAMLAAQPLSAPVEVQVKVNTGMNRLGFAGAARFADAVARLQAIAGLRVTTAVMHFANADVADAAGAAVVVPAQLAAFAAALGDWRGQRSVANSAALFLRDDVGGDWVRPGIALYGGAPSELPAAALGLRPAMTLRSRLLAVQTLRAGERVGYGSRWSAPRAARIGVVACGYADGYPRIAADGTPVAVDGRIAPLIGRVSMDMLTVDLTALPQAQPGSAVELWGAQVPIDAVAAGAGTVGYELMCALAPRVPVAVED